MSEELENSLQQAVETYLNERLRVINDQLARMQADLSEAIARLSESSQTHSLEGSTLSAAIFAHLQTARGQRLSGATFSAATGADAGAIKRAVADIEGRQSQAEILKALLGGAAQFAERVALFIVKNDQAIGWRMASAGDPGNSQPIGGVSLSLNAQTNLTNAIHSQSPSLTPARPNAEDHLLLDQLGGSAEIAAVVPLVVRGKVVAALYADSVSSDPAAINMDALEILTRVAAMTVNIASIHKTAVAPKREEAEPPREVAQPETTEAVAAYTPQVEAQTEEVEPPAQEVSAAPAEAPLEAQPVRQTWTEETVEAQQPGTAAEPESIAEAQPAPVAQVSAPQAAAPVTEEFEAAPAPETQRQPEPVSHAVEATETQPGPSSAPESIPALAPEQPAVPEQPAAPQPAAPQPEITSHYAAPLGSARRYGVSEPELPIEVGDEERRLHNDARRFARLLVSEIKLYNENKVNEGRSNSDLYDRLRDDIDRSRQMYDRRVAPPVAARHDYFHQELVNLLAEGDAAKLGQSYPGAVVTA